MRIITNGKNYKGGDRGLFHGFVTDFAEGYRMTTKNSGFERTPPAQET